MPDNSVVIPPNIVSTVTAVSASNGVGAGRMIPFTPPLIVPLTATVSSSSIAMVYVALVVLSPAAPPPLE